MHRYALVVIDMQRGFLDASSPLFIPGAADTVPACARAIDCCHRAGVPVVFAVRHYRADGSDVERARYDVWARGGRPLSETCPPSMSDAWPEEFHRADTDYVIVKPRFSAFFHTELDLILRRLGVDTVLLAGTTTPNCIRSTFYDALSLDYDAAVLSDCTSSVTPAVQAANLADMQRVGGQVLTAEELEQIEQRLDLLHKLKRKYGASVEDVLAFLEQARSQLDEIEFASDRIERLRAQLAKQDAEVQQAGLALREARKRAAVELEKRIQTELSQLDMPKVQFQCQFEEQKPQETGLDLVRFLMSANVGEALRPMAKVASGGELARIMLAMKNVLAEQDAIPTLIFDEVDAGVSGRAAQKVAEKLWAVAQAGKQVLCVTHLPQIAAMADRQYTVEKRVEGGRTYTRVHLLDEDGRVQELARLVGGAAITETTLAGARELLATALSRKERDLGCGQR